MTCFIEKKSLNRIWLEIRTEFNYLDVPKQISGISFKAIFLAVTIINQYVGQL